MLKANSIYILKWRNSVTADVNQIFTKDIAPATNIKQEMVNIKNRIGALLNLANGIRPDITFAVNTVAKFTKW